MISLLLLLPPKAVHVDAGYYSLSELAAVTARQGTSLDIPSSLRDETYLINLNSVEPATLARALEATGRLVVTANGDGWTVRRNLTDEQADTIALDRYLNGVREGIDKTYGTAIRIINRLAQLPVEARGEQVDELARKRSKDESENQVNSLVYLFFGNELSYMQLQQALELSSKKPRPMLGKMILLKTDLNTNPGLLSPGLLPSQGDGVVRLGPEKTLAKSTPIEVASKLVFDPATGAVAIRNGVLVREYGLIATVSPTNAPILGPTWKAPSAQVLFGDKAGDFTARVEASGTVASLKGAETKVALPTESLRVSEALLRVSGKSGIDLVGYVGPFGDRYLPASGPASLISVIGMAMQSRFDAGADQRRMAEYVQPGLAGSMVDPAAPLSAIVIDKIVVVRDERDYLDGLLASPSGIPHALENANLKGQAPRLSEIVDHVNSAGVSHWRTSLFSSRYLNFCNPVSLVPFARTYVVSPQLRSLLANIKPDQTATLPVSKLEPAAAKALAAGLAEVSACNDAVDSLTCDPFMITIEHNMAAVNQGEIRIQRSQNQYSLSIVNGGGIYWRSWVANVRSDNGN